MKNKILVTLVLAIFSLNIGLVNIADAKGRSSSSRSSSSSKSYSSSKSKSSSSSSSSKSKSSSSSSSSKSSSSTKKLDSKTQRKVDAKKKRNTEKLNAAKKKKDEVVKKQTAALNSVKDKTKNWSSSDYTKNSADLKNKLKAKWYDDKKIDSYRSTFNTTYPSYSWLGFWDYFFLYWLFSGNNTELTSASNAVSAYTDNGSISDDTNENIANELTGTQFSKADQSDLIPAVNEILLAHKADYILHKTNYSIFTMNSNFYKITSSIAKLDDATSIYKVSSIKRIDKLAAVPLMLENNSYTNNDMAKRLVKSFLSEMYVTNKSTKLFDSATCTISTGINCEVVEDGVFFDTKYVVKANIVNSSDKTRIVLKNVTAYKK